MTKMEHRFGIAVLLVVVAMTVSTQEVLSVCGRLSYSPGLCSCVTHDLLTCTNANITKYSSLVSGVTVDITCDMPGTVPAVSVGAVQTIKVRGCVTAGMTLRKVTDPLGVARVTNLVVAGEADSPSRSWFTDLPDVEGLTLSGWGFRAVPEDTLESRISRLDLSSNLVWRLPPRVFYGLERLQELTMSNNRLTDLPPGLFDRSRLLTHLALDGNNLENISSEVLAPLTHLKTLMLYNNRLKTLGEDVWMLPGLERLWLGKNRLTRLGEGERSVLRGCTRLAYLSINNNQFTTMHSRGLTSLFNLQRIDLSANRLQSLQVCDFDFLASRPIEVSLRYNNISSVNTTNCEEDTEMVDEHNRVIMDLSTNPLTCDCDMHGLASLARAAGHILLVGRKFEFKPSEMSCGSPAALRGDWLTSIPLEQFTCPIPVEDEDMLPADCRCYYRPEGRYNVVDCTGVRLTPETVRSLPTHPLATQTQLILSHSHLDLDLDTFVYSATGLLNNVTHLNLSYTSLTDFTVSESVTPLKVLDLSHNQLTSLSAVTVTVLRGLDWLVLHHNPWRCSCDDLDFIDLVTKQHKVNIYQRDEIVCADGKSLDLRERCPVSRAGVFLWAGLSVVLAVSLVARVYRKELLVRLYSSNHRLLRRLVSHPDDVNRHLPYDVFVSFAHEDEHFVTGHLLPQLSRYKVCLHYRDWLPGQMIGRNIIRSIVSSRRTVIVMSPSYLRSKWGSYEFEIAHMEGFRNYQTRMVVVMYRDIEDEYSEVPESVRLYLRTITYLRWEDTEDFWKRLHYAMPHPPADGDRVRCAISWCWCEQCGDETIDMDELEEEMLRIEPHALVPESLTH